MALPDADAPSLAPLQVRKCMACKRDLPLTDFPLKRGNAGAHGERTVTCLPCKVRKDNWRVAAIQTKKSNVYPSQSEENQDESATTASDTSASLNTDALSEFVLGDFLAMLGRQKDTLSLEVNVNISELHGTMKERADALAGLIWEMMRYRFTYHSKYDHRKKRSAGVKARFMYHCAQNSERQQGPRKVPDTGKRRDKEAMHVFDCKGWLHITLDDVSDIVFVKLDHQEAHVPYWPIDIPSDVEQFVQENLRMTPTQLWKEILKKHPTPSFSRKSIYQMWSELTSQEWKRDPDEMKSAKILLDEAREREDVDNLYAAQTIPITDEEGYTSVAFALPDVLRKWGGRVREVSLDSAWNTNGSGYEVYALLGEVYGSGVPLAYIIIRSDSGSPGGKERYISQLLRFVRDQWEIRAIFTLTDKDWSEINAFLDAYPDAKHQLCFWHCLRAIKTRLSILRRAPAYYNAEMAHAEFGWIDVNFLPTGQRATDIEKPVAEADTYTAQKAIPRLTIRLNGILQTLPAPPQERLVIRIPRAPRACDPAPVDALQPPGDTAVGEGGAATTDTIDRASRGGTENASDGPDYDLGTADMEDGGLEEADLEGGELLDQVDRFLDDEDAVDEEDGPDWLFEDGEHKVDDPEYVFCPAPHRKHLLHIFTKHFCQHPLFPEQDGPQSREEIRKNAVMEMYVFCHQRGLREVWAYMWTSWYSRKMWKLWARSTANFISRLRTTMNVENFWRRLKHDYLHHLLRPRLDLLVWVLISTVTPDSIARSEILEDTHRLGRSKPLSTYQKYFKTSWRALAIAPVSGKSYDTNVASWTCNCRRQKYDRHHLCKHLVQAVPSPSIRFWRQVYRRRITPIYRHPELVAISSADGLEVPVYYEDPNDGSITDGDDHVWLGDAAVLRGGGGWEDFDIQTSLGKRSRSSTSLHDEDEVLSDTDSTAGALVHDAARAGSSRPFAHEYGEEEDALDELNEKIQLLSLRATELRQAADIIDAQLPYQNRIWITSVADRGIGNDVSLLVKDVRHVESTGRHRDTTWARPGDREGARRVRNTMGYHWNSNS